MNLIRRVDFILFCISLIRQLDFDACATVVAQLSSACIYPRINRLLTRHILHRLIRLKHPLS